MTVTAVVFDWGGTLTPWHDVDLLDLWLAAARQLAPDRAPELAAGLIRAERNFWAEAMDSQCSGTIEDIVRAAARETGVDVDPALHGGALDAHFEAWTPHTYTDPAAAPLLVALREMGLRIGLLSNTHWPRAWHERILERDGVAELFDARVYTSELPYVKPHPSAFATVLAQLEVAQPGTAVFVGDRPFDDISGAKGAGMRAVLMPDSRVPAYDVEPDATIGSLADLLPLVQGWM